MSWWSHGMRFGRGIEWPYQPVRYEPHWPEHPGELDPARGLLQRIVNRQQAWFGGMTWGGRLQGALDPEHWDGISIIASRIQPLPGYNPNEEHARIYPSLLERAWNSNFGCICTSGRPECLQATNQVAPGNASSQ